LPDNLIESELFGYEKGAFTSADTRKAGRFELADGGSLFLDEIGELPYPVQSKLLRVLEDGTFERIGGIQTIQVNVCIIAATNQNLLTLVEKGQFRRDLYYRLNIFPIYNSTLQERKGDYAKINRIRSTSRTWSSGSTKLFGIKSISFPIRN